MKTLFNYVVIVISFLYFSGSLMAQDKPAILQDSNHITLKTRDSINSEDSTLFKKKSPIEEAGFSSDSMVPAQSHFQLNATYQSNNVWLGRKDTSVLPLLTPQISYIFKSGFEINFNVGIDVKGPVWQLNSYVLNVSYSFDAGNYAGAALLSASNYSLNSESIQAGQNGSLEFDNSYDFGFIQPSLNLSWIFAEIPDYMIVFALQHEYDFLNNGNLNITPAATVNASTQNVYSSYYHDRKYRVHRPGTPPLPGNGYISGEVVNSGKFQIMDYELSAPVNYAAGKWTFNFSPTYAVAVNPVDILLSSKINNITYTKTYKEPLSNSFYYQVGVTYAF